MYMGMPRYLFCLFSFLFCCTAARAQVAGEVYDSASGKPIPFATIRYGLSGSGTIADLDGKFNSVSSLPPSVKWLEISSTGYTARRVILPLTNARVLLARSANNLAEVVIKPPYDKIRRILNNAIANKSANNPEKYDWYRCNVYYKMIVDIRMPDSVLQKDTSADSREFKEFMQTQHLLMSETYSVRTWKQPQQLQEQVTGSRFSGLKKSLFTGLVTDVLPFHAYTDYLSLNGKDYHNPVSRGYEQYYKFDLVDELQQGGDTVWVLGYKPRGNNANQLRGRVYINSNGFAIANFIGTALDTSLKRDIRIEQEYKLVEADGQQHWFPVHLNYIIDWQQKSKDGPYNWYLKGTSRIDSVSFREDKNFKFDKAHTTVLQQGADELNDAAWQQLRPDTLDSKERKTYHIIDSFGEAKHFDRLMGAMAHLPEGRVSIGKLDLDITRLFRSNRYEGTRVGLGLQTNERLIKWLSVGGYAGYGFRDVHWKYGAFAEVYADKNREFSIRASYTDDINDPGRVHLNSDLDKNYLNAYLLYRVDRIITSSLGMKKKLGYWNLELTGRQQQITPKYDYVFNYKGDAYNSFTARELSFGFRYAFAERTAPFFNTYYSVGTKYPIWYGRVTAGTLTAGANQLPYVQALTAVAWQKHINRIGNERFLVSAGKIWSNDPLPLSKLFAGAGYRYDPKDGSGISLYSFGGFMTMYPYGYYSDQYVSVLLRHDFDRRLYKLAIPGTALSSSPFIGLQYNMLYGTLQQRQAQQQVAFSVPDNAYHEVGALLNSILMQRYLNLYYFTLNAGYFYHLADQGTAKTNGKVVFGINVEF
jgi:hypothetical protein